jgi:hypothetical protein
MGLTLFTAIKEMIDLAILVATGSLALNTILYIMWGDQLLRADDMKKYAEQLITNLIKAPNNEHRLALAKMAAEGIEIKACKAIEGEYESRLTDAKKKN